MPCRFRLARGVALLALGLTTGCAPGLTPQQEVTWDAFKACQKEGSATLSRLNVDGSSVISGREGDVHRVITCMDAYRRKASLEGRTPAVPASVRINPAAAGADALVVPAPPVWTTGDRWRFQSISAGGRRTTYTQRVDREETLDGVAYYVIKTGTRETFYRKSDLALSHDTVRGELDTRRTPPRLYFIWPLTVGATWEQTYHFERLSNKHSYDSSYAAGVEGEETVTVPAGTFRALKIVNRDASKKSVIWELWYAPDVRMWVRMREPALEEGERVRELLEFTAAGK